MDSGLTGGNRLTLEVPPDYTKPHDASVALYEQTVAQFPRSEAASQAQYAIGRVWFAKREYARAVQALSKQLAAYPAAPLTAQARYTRGLAYQQLRPGSVETRVKTAASEPTAQADAAQAHPSSGSGQAPVATRPARAPR